MGWGTGGSGSVPHGSTSPAVGELAGTGITVFGGTGALEVGVIPDSTVEAFEMERRTAPMEMLRRTKPFEMTRR